MKEDKEREEEIPEIEETEITECPGLDDKICEFCKEDPCECKEEWEPQEPLNCEPWEPEIIEEDE